MVGVGARHWYHDAIHSHAKGKSAFAGECFFDDNAGGGTRGGAECTKWKSLV